MKRLWAGCKIAFSMYSKIPMPKTDWSKENMRYALCFFPWVGAVIGALVWCFGVFISPHGLTNLFSACILTLIPVFVTGGIHLYGFLDTMDALSSYQEQERKLEILKDSHAGAFAIISGIVYFVLQLGVYSQMKTDSFAVAAWVFVFSRSLSGLSLVTFPMAKNTGLAAMFSDGAQKKKVRLTMIFYLAICVGMMLWFDVLKGTAAILTGALVFVYYYRMSKKEFGGITGDLAGYFLQMCELLMLSAIVLTEWAVAL